MYNLFHQTMELYLMRTLACELFEYTFQWLNYTLRNLIWYQLFKYSTILGWGGWINIVQILPLLTNHAINHSNTYQQQCIHSHQYTKHKDFMWKPIWEKTMAKLFLIYSQATTCYKHQSITMLSRTNLKETPIPYVSYNSQPLHHPSTLIFYISSLFNHFVNLKWLLNLTPPFHP